MFFIYLFHHFIRIEKKIINPHKYLCAALHCI